MLHFLPLNGERASSIPALWWVGDQGNEVRWGFEELGFLSRKAANVLSDACGLKKGDRVIVMLPRIPELWLITVGCMRTGIIYIPATIMLTANDIFYRLQASKAKCIITNDTLAPAVDSIVSKCEFLKTRLIVSEGSRDGWLDFKKLFKDAHDDHDTIKTKSQEPMTIYFTSGTTGYPKMVEHSHSSFGIGMTSTGRLWLDLNPSDVLWGLSDPGWVKFAYSCFFSTWIQGACIFTRHMLQFEATTVLDCLSRFPVTSFCGTPTTYRMMAQHDLTRYKFKSLKRCLSGGEPLSTEVMERWKKETGMDIYEGYGQSETVLICSLHKGMKIKPGSMGKATPPYDVQVIDENANVLPPGKEGDIAIRIKPTRPFCLFSHYVDDPEKTAASERGDFYLTGDRGIVDEDRYFWFIGRADDIILSSGYRIGPYEVEYALMEHPAVAEAAVVSSPDPIRGELVKAFVILSPDFASHDPKELTKELQNHVKKITAPYKYPRKVEFVQQLPKTISGKVQRKKLRQKEWEST
ncbi:acyl-coenzyme A synthetase ACSM3, mitochondrial-like isoform X2 [Pelodiscus sinensis]|uniref:acyl-coenzyme A synthetase ACSM3, mitochondrial-like isoform X2 n=1 Tax=Pelodiscus sinensis TaxID=13735 RepID=UPI000D71F4ED|nr:acyl-coenzyme A synthetase ACSM3, mitochondrial-like isoform X2 [Pelodiscus sinensis]|eukprot:XP_025040482.1 acyl-coenzyme A synthetase ACSM3, mitochondrial-like isoform X2 [Pelodiscus sinensis]